MASVCDWINSSFSLFLLFILRNAYFLRWHYIRCYFFLKAITHACLCGHLGKTTKSNYSWHDMNEGITIFKRKCYWNWKWLHDPELFGHPFLFPEIPPTRWPFFFLANSLNTIKILANSFNAMIWIDFFCSCLSRRVGVGMAAWAHGSCCL